MSTSPSQRIELPPRPFLFTLDQVATMLALSTTALHRYCHFDGRSIGVRPRDRLATHNIAPAGSRPDWRVSERELKRWLKVKGFRVHERGWVS